MLKHRMYHFVIYQLSGIQAGIQAGHAKDQYSIAFGDTDEYQKWLKNEKTVIILNGGTTNSQGFDYYSKAPYIGTMNDLLFKLTDFGIKAEPFYEPDLNNAMTAIAFLISEKIYDEENYPDMRIGNPSWKSHSLEIRDWLKTFSLAKN